MTETTKEQRADVKRRVEFKPGDQLAVLMTDTEAELRKEIERLRADARLMANAFRQCVDGTWTAGWVDQYGPTANAIMRNRA